MQGADVAALKPQNHVHADVETSRGGGEGGRGRVQGGCWPPT